MNWRSLGRWLKNVFLPAPIKNCLHCGKPAEWHDLVAGQRWCYAKWGIECHAPVARPTGETESQ
jgi:hypothetical protein